MFKVQEVFGKFAIDLGNGPELFNTEAEALAKISQFENGSKQLALANEFCKSIGLDVESKAAKGKVNVIIAYLQWLDVAMAQAQVVAGDDTFDLQTEEIPTSGDITINPFEAVA